MGMSRPAAREGALLLACAAGIAAGCAADGGGYLVEVRFPSADLLARTTSVDVYVVPACGDLASRGTEPADPLVSLSVAPGDPSRPLGSIPRGRVGIYARAHDASGCAVIATGCAEHQVEGGGAGTLSVTLAERSSETACSDDDPARQSDVLHCGRCDVICKPTEECHEGVCRAPRVLFYGPRGTLEATSLPAGCQVDVWTDAEPTTTQEFSKYDLVVIGDGAADDPSSRFNLAASTASAWSPAIDGRAVVTGFNAALDSPGDDAFLRGVLRWLLEGPGTALYVSSNRGRGIASHLAGVDLGFAAGGGPPGTALVVAPDHPILQGIDARTLPPSHARVLLRSDEGDWTILATESATPVAAVVAAREARTPRLLAYEPTGLAEAAFFDGALVSAVNAADLDDPERAPSLARFDVLVLGDAGGDAACLPGSVGSLVATRGWVEAAARWRASSGAPVLLQTLLAGRAASGASPQAGAATYGSQAAAWLSRGFGTALYASNREVVEALGLDMVVVRPERGDGDAVEVAATPHPVVAEPQHLDARALSGWAPSHRGGLAVTASSGFEALASMAGNAEAVVAAARGPYRVRLFEAGATAMICTTASDTSCEGIDAHRGRVLNRAGASMFQTIPRTTAIRGLQLHLVLFGAACMDPMAPGTEYRVLLDGDEVARFDIRMEGAEQRLTLAVRRDHDVGNGSVELRVVAATAIDPMRCPGGWRLQPGTYAILY